MRTTVNILGTEYKIIKRDYLDEPYFEKNNLCGYCSYSTKTICVGNLATFPEYQNESDVCIKTYEKETLRHEIIHAFLSESGLQDNACIVKGAWAVNEEMVDWMSIQFPKIAKVFEELKIL